MEGSLADGGIAPPTSRIVSCALPKGHHFTATEKSVLVFLNLGVLNLVDGSGLAHLRAAWHC